MKLSMARNGTLIAPVSVAILPRLGRGAYQDTCYASIQIGIKLEIAPLVSAYRSILLNFLELGIRLPRRLGIATMPSGCTLRLPLGNCLVQRCECPATVSAVCRCLEISTAYL
ncbi:MAG TPA: hypothetical protein DIW77_12055, partial [Chromatiaceae bacterium]|nr:hypothetical protein [Chromatiaceae bacterium]